MAQISKGIKLFHGEVELTNLQEIPDLGGDTESIEITTLADAAHMYVNGIKNYGVVVFNGYGNVYSSGIAFACTIKCTIFKAV